MGKRKNRQYTLEFKEQAADLARRIGSTNASKQLGVPVSSIHQWKKDSVKSEPINKNGKINLEEENRRLQKENDELKKVNHILKRAAAFFSQDHLK
jgi:transposase-like protein